MAYTDIDKPEDYFNTKLWSGNSTTSTGITGVGFQPDLVWIKNRTDVNSHALFDVIRTATNYIESDTTDAEATNSEFLQSFDSDGFTLGNAGRVNFSGQNYVGWSWLGGGTASSNTSGSITSNVSANTTSGFSIVSYTGTGSDATVGHGLSSAPDMVIVKSRDAVRNWPVYHRSLGGDDSLKLNLTDATTTSLDCWNDLDPTSSVVHLGTTGGSNISGEDAIMYCFHSVKGFSKMGSYTGNGSADGTFVYTGFRPAFIMIKKSSGTENWSMYDTKRNINGTTNTLPLTADTTSAEASNTGKNMDILSNGVKMYTSNGELNLSGETYIYMCFAENPLVSSAGVPCTAR